jgi:peptidoglycan DL-endopeptidase CwlO
MKTKIKQISFVFASAVIVAGALFSPYSVFKSGTAKAVSLSQLQEQASDLQDQINANNAEANRLAGEADSLKGKIAEFDLQIRNADAQIQLITIKLQQLDEELKKAQAELDRQKTLLKASIQTLYKKGGASTVELIVGSDSFSQYINDQTYLERLKAGIQTSTEKVIALKQQIQTQQDEQKLLLSQQQEIRRNLDVARAERQQLLDATQGEEARYRTIANDLKAQQLAINREIIARSQVLVGSDGGYPYKNAQPWNSGFYSCAGFDPWAMCKRSCTSFAAWRTASSGRYMPTSGLGNARLWPGSARALGIPTGTAPQQGAVAVWTSGAYGHVAFVEEIYDDGRIRVSEYNFVQDGRYDERIITPGYSQMPNQYIYFPTR